MHEGGSLGRSYLYYPLYVNPLKSILVIERLQQYYPLSVQQWDIAQGKCTPWPVLYAFICPIQNVTELAFDLC